MFLAKQMATTVTVCKRKEHFLSIIIIIIIIPVFLQLYEKCCGRHDPLKAPYRR